MFAVVRIRGTNKVAKKVEDTMRMLRLKAANHCVLLPETPDVKGMLQKAKDYITWGEVSKDMIARILEKRLRSRGTERRVDARNLKEVSGFDSFDAFASAIESGETRIQKHEGLNPVFRLTPPSGGLRSVNEHFPRGDLGYRGRDIEKLLERMI